MDWLALAAPVALLVLVLFLPGLAVARLGLGLTGITAVSLAPTLSLFVVALATFVTMLPGVGWGLLPILAATIGVVGLLWLGLRGRRPEAQGWLGATNLAGYAALVLAFALMVPHIVGVLGRPDAYSQSADSSFHLSLARYIALTGHAAPRFPSTLTPDGTIFTDGSLPEQHSYQTLFAAINALPMVTWDAPITLATNSAIVVVSAFVWPAACVYAVLRLVGPRPVTLLLTGALSAAMTSYPFTVVSYGVVYPTSRPIRSGASRRRQRRWRRSSIRPPRSPTRTTPSSSTRSLS